MIRNKTLYLMLALMVLSCVPSWAAASCRADTFHDWDGAFTIGWEGVAQIITPPPSCTVLLEFQFGVAGRSSDGTLEFAIYEWSGTGPVGDPLFLTQLPWGTDPSVMVVANLNLNLTVGKKYGVVVRLHGYSDRSVAFENRQNGYARGNAWWSDGNQWFNLDSTDLAFRMKWGKAK